MRKCAFPILQIFLFSAVFLLAALSDIQAATVLIENSNPIENPGIQLELHNELIVNEETSAYSINSETKKNLHPSNSEQKLTPNKPENKDISPFTKKNEIAVNKTIKQNTNSSDSENMPIPTEKEKHNPSPNNKETEQSLNKETNQENHTSDFENKVLSSVTANQQPAPIESFTTTEKNKTIQSNIALPFYNILKGKEGALNKILEDETIDEIVLISKDINLRLNQLNQEIDHKIAPAIEELLILNQLFSMSGSEGQYYFSDYKALSHTSPDNNPYSDPKLNNIAIEETDGILGLLIELPKFFLNLQNILLFIIILFLISGVMKAIHFALNNIY